DVEEILLGLYPAKVMLDAAEIVDVPKGFAALLRFLGLDRPGHEPPFEVLGELAERLASRFHAAMNDEDNWSFGKRMWSTAMAEGVDLDNEAALGQWVEGFNQRSIGERDQILGRLPVPPPGVGSPLIGSLPPVVLPSDDELRTMASRTVVVRRLIQLVDYVGAGRAVTDKGNLKVADGKELVALLGTDDRIDTVIGDRVFKTKSSEEFADVDFTYRLALAANMLAVDGRKLVPGPNASRCPDAPLDICYGAFLVLLQLVGPTQHHYRRHVYGWDWFAEELDRLLASMMLELYRRRDPYAIDELVEWAWHDLNATFDLSDVPTDKLEFHRGLVDWSLRRALDRLTELGVVIIADETSIPTQYGGNERSGGTVRLPPLGLWAVQRMLSRITNAPVVGALRSSSAPELLRAAADLPEDIARAEIDAWIEHHGDHAAGELCAAIRDADETGRGLAFRGLLHIGTDAAAAVAALADDPELAPFVTVWRVDTFTASPEEMDRSGDPEGWIRLLHTVLELWGPQAAAAAWAGPAAGVSGIDAMLNTAWRVKGQRTEDVLAAIGGHHPDKHIAKAARKAMFKHRSAR
ncbi:MAG: hypothetical protein AAB018_03685, partial [Actinomycetota bacterium]